MGFAETTLAKAVPAGMKSGSRVSPHDRNSDGLSLCAILAEAMVRVDVVCSVTRKGLRWSVGSVVVLVVLLTGLAVASLPLRTEA